jgi:bifunctional non-homologous end joining protein LigD
LSVGGKDVRHEPLEERRARLEGLLAGVDGDLPRFSETFDDAEKLLAAALELGLEGIVSKKRDQPCRPGKNVG